MKKNLTSWLIAALIAALGVLLFALPARAGEEKTALLLTACHNGTCEDRDITPSEGISFIQCSTWAIVIAAKFLNQNKPEGWTIRRVSCVYGPEMARL